MTSRKAASDVAQSLYKSIAEILLKQQNSIS